MVQESASAGRNVAALILLHIPAGAAKPRLRVGPALGHHLLNHMASCKEFNHRTQNYKPDVFVPVKINAYSQRLGRSCCRPGLSPPPAASLSPCAQPHFQRLSQAKQGGHRMDNTCHGRGRASSGGKSLPDTSLRAQFESGNDGSESGGTADGDTKEKGSREFKTEAKAALLALDLQLARLKQTGEEGSASKSSQQRQARDSSLPHSTEGVQSGVPTFLGRDASGEGWPEFDATFFTYSSLALLLITALANWVFVFSQTTAEGSRTDSQELAALQRKNAKADRLALLYQQVLGDAPGISASSQSVEIPQGL